MKNKYGSEEYISTATQRHTAETLFLQYVSQTNLNKPLTTELELLVPQASRLLM